MIASERRREILEALNVSGIIGLKDISARLGVAEITIRRDFEKLEGEGRLKRVQGGASLENREAAELTMSQKLPIHMAEKERLALCADKLVSAGDCVFIDAGTTALPLVSLLVKKQVRIVTYNTLLLGKFKKTQARLFMVGGEYLPYYNMYAGPMAQEALRQFHFDFAFIGCAGLDLAQGAVFTTEQESLSMKKIAMENSAKNILLADRNKLAMRGFLKIADTEAFDSIMVNDFPHSEPLPDNLRLVE